MKHIKIIGLAVVVVLAMCVSAASASATGFKVFPQKKVETSSGKATLETAVTKVKVKCTSSASKNGEIKTATELAKITVVFVGCELFGTPCQSGATSGEISTETLSGLVGDITPTTVGVDLKPTKSKGNLAVFKCGATEIHVTGSVIGKIGPVGEETSTFSLAFAQKEGVQTIQKFEGGEKDTLLSQTNNETPEAAGQEAEKGTLTTPANNEVVA